MKKKSLVGWTHLVWKDFFYWAGCPETLTKQNVFILRVPFITNPCTKYIDKRSHKKVKVKITIEEI